MADFDTAVKLVLEREGGYSNDPLDPGGETNFGISKANYPNEDIRNLTVEDAKAIYLKDYWRFGQVTSQVLGEKLLDMAVNMGLETSIRLLQRALGFKEDGVFGPLTAASVNKANPETLLPELRARAAARHALICINKPTEARFLLGWLRRDCV